MYGRFLALDSKHYTYESQKADRLKIESKNNILN